MNLVVSVGEGSNKENQSKLIILVYKPKLIKKEIENYHNKILN